MTGLHIALGFKSASTFEDPKTIYLGNDIAQARAAIAEAVASKKYGRILSGFNFAHSLRKVSLAQAVVVKIDCSPEANARHKAALAESFADQAKSAEAEAARKKAEGEAVMAEHRELHKAAGIVYRNAPPKPAAAAPAEPATPARGKNVGKKSEAK